MKGKGECILNVFRRSRCIKKLPKHAKSCKKLMIHKKLSHKFAHISSTEPLSNNNTEQRMENILFCCVLTMWKVPCDVLLFSTTLWSISQFWWLDFSFYSIGRVIVDKDTFHVLCHTFDDCEQLCNAHDNDMWTKKKKTVNHWSFTGILSMTPSNRRTKAKWRWFTQYIYFFWETEKIYHFIHKTPVCECCVSHQIRNKSGNK